MSLKKKVPFILASASLFVALLSGCVGEESSSSSATGEKTLTLLIDTQSSRAGIEAVAKLIDEKYDIKTEFETRPGGTEGDNIVKTRLATGDMTDMLFYNSGSLMQALNPEKNLVDLTEEPFMENVMDSYKDTVTSNNKIFGIPAASVSVGGWFYNKKVYEELGLSVPRTWDELMANNEKIKEAGKTAVIGSYKDTWTSQLIVLADNYNVLAKNPEFPEEYTKNKAKMATTPAALKSFEKLQEIYDKGYMNKEFLSTNYDTALKMLAEGTGVHYPMLSQLLPSIKQNYPDLIDDIGVFPQPGDSAEHNGFTVWMPSTIYLNKNSENVDVAKKWAEIFLSEEGIEAYLSAMTPEGPFAISGVELPEDVYGAVKEMMPYFEAEKTAPALEFLSPIKGPNLEQITTEIGGGIKSAKEGAKSYDKDVEKQAKQLGLEGW